MSGKIDSGNAGAGYPVRAEMGHVMGNNPSGVRAPIAGNWDRKPFLVIWEITQACALACRHCRAEARPCRSPLELDEAASRALIEQVARANPSIFILTGGDPRMRPDLENLVDYAALLGLRVAISPSATPRWLNTDLGHLKALGLSSLSISMDGASEATHDAFRGVPGTWKRTMRAIESAKDAGLYLQINTTITKQNLRELPEFFRVMEDVRPGMWSIFNLVPTGRAAMDDLPDATEIERLFEQLAEAAPSVPYAIKTTEGHHFRRVLLQKRVLPKGGHGLAGMQGVGDGRGFVFISHTGEIFPSGFLPFSCGNVRSQELIDVYRDSPVFRSLRDAEVLKGKCGRCEFRKICGGSRARAYAMTGDYLAEEPLCVYQPKGGAGRLPGFANAWNATA